MPFAAALRPPVDCIAIPLAAAVCLGQIPLYFAVEDEGVSGMLADVRRAEEEGRGPSATGGG